MGFWKTPGLSPKDAKVPNGSTSSSVFFNRLPYADSVVSLGAGEALLLSSLEAMHDLVTTKGAGHKTKAVAGAQRKSTETMKLFIFKFLCFV